MRLNVNPYMASIFLVFIFLKVKCKIRAHTDILASIGAGKCDEIYHDKIIEIHVKGSMSFDFEMGEKEKDGFVCLW